jgi:tRNA nucleotidyltransferase (CCA-adding enzyme)
MGTGNVERVLRVELKRVIVLEMLRINCRKRNPSRLERERERDDNVYIQQIKWLKSIERFLSSGNWMLVKSQRKADESMSSNGLVNGIQRRTRRANGPQMRRELRYVFRNALVINH